MTSWSDHAIWWQIYPLGFTGAPAAAPEGAGAVRHRLERLERWLDYAVELGCSGLMLGPVFASETHGYDTVDHFRIDPRLGDDADFDRLATAARGRGLHLLLDGVFNHVGRGFAQFARARGDASAARWFRHRTGPDGRTDFDTFEGHERLVALNHDEPAVAEHVIAVMDHWLGRGASGWRLDAAYAVPAAFWRRTLPEVRRRHPDAWFVGEMIHGDYAAYAAESGLDSITQYELWKAIWSALNDRNLFELAWALDRHEQVMKHLTPQTFIGNHDVTRPASLLTDERHLGHALAVLFTVGGVPSVYYGDEQAFRGVKEHREGGDDEIRPAFPDDPGELAPYGMPTYRLHQRLIGLRRRNPWLVTARTTVEHLTNRAVALRSAGGPGQAQIITLLNVDDDPYRFPLGMRHLETGDLVSENLTVAESSEPASGPAGPAGDPLVVPAHGWSILTVS